MTKEIIWNLSILIFGIFLILVFTINMINSPIIPGWHSNSLFPSFGVGSKIKLGLIVGVLLIVFRYLNLGILSIQNKDLKLLVLLISYSVPILVVLIGLHFWVDKRMSNFNKQVFPIEQLKKEISELRTVGMFKSYSDKSDEFVTELAIGRAISKQDGWANSKQYWNIETNQINKLEILRLDNEKVWQEEDTEFIVEGNRAYEDVITELGQISEGNFNPIEIKEDWETRDKIVLSFKNEGKKHVIYPKVFNDWADMDGVIKYVNNEILDTADFKFYYGNGGDILVIGLTENEREELSKLTELEFEKIR